MPSTTRRRLLGAGAALAAGAYAARRLDRGALDASFASWTPDPGTWPLRRYDPANTAYNPTARPPREPPTVRERRSVATGGRRPRFALLVGHDYLVLHGSGLAVYPRDGGEAARLDPVDAPFAGLGPDGRLHATRTVGDGPDPSLSLASYAPDLAVSARRSLGTDDPAGLTVGARGVCVGTESGRIVGLTPANGRRWQVDGARPALADGRLYAADASLDGVVAYAERSGLDRRLTPGPARVWSAGPTDGFPALPAVADGRVVVGSRAADGGVLRAIDAATGEELWTPRSLGQSVSTPAVVGDRGYAAVGADDRTTGSVVAVDLATGETVWRDATEWSPASAAVGGETLVVAGGVDPDGGRVRAYDRANGDVYWTRDLPARAPDGLALVGERVLATVGASLYELA
ncbi:MAG: PQQ-binding-like beta-propeller repeat protein [Haloferacaceae archaeon]